MKVSINRCSRLGLKREQPFLTLLKSQELRKTVDHYIDKKIEEWNHKVPYATHFQEGKIHPDYYKRFLIETALRIRLLRVSESKALSDIVKISPEAAQIWANYEREEMLHDKLFLDDFKRAGGTNDEFYNTEPYLSTKLLTGFFSYLLDHEGPLGVVTYSYLVEYVNVKLDPDKVKGMTSGLGEEKILGQISHTHTDLTDDHPGEVWDCLRYLIRNEDDTKSILKYIDEHQRILALFFEEIYDEVVLGRAKGTQYV